MLPPLLPCVQEDDDADSEGMDEFIEDDEGGGRHKKARVKHSKHSKENMESYMAVFDPAATQIGAWDDDGEDEDRRASYVRRGHTPLPTLTPLSFVPQHLPPVSFLALCFLLTPLPHCHPPCPYPLLGSCSRSRRAPTRCS